ncbi:MAG: HD-GYP domain-containing protein [Treponema sp.]|nr:HD-GYP domain-containing protein [Treponema sp.]
METITLESLREEQTFKDDLLIDENFILLPHSCPVTKELLAALREWEFTTISTDEPLRNEAAPSTKEEAPVQEQSAEPAASSANASDDKGAGSSDQFSKNQTGIFANGADAVKIGESLKKALEDSKTDQKNNSDYSRMEMVRKVYDEYLNYIEGVFRYYATHKQINQEEISETVKELCIFIKENKRFILRVDSSKEYADKNFLVRHSMRSTVLALVIGLQLRMPLSKMIELGVACIIHEIGMLCLPPSVYMTDKQLTLGERTQILKHTLFGYSIAKNLNFPLSIQLGILEHHEKENGTGYPRRLTGDKISINAKIISVACSYEAITAPRSYKDERSQFEAMIELLKNPDHQYDDTVIKALLYSVSLYPIGAYVYLTNRKIAVVVDTNPDNPKFPIVQSISEKEADGSPKIIQTSPDGITIARILSKREQEDIIKLQQERYKAIEEAQRIAEENMSHQQTNPEPANKPAGDVNAEPVGQMEEVDISLFT